MKMIKQTMNNKMSKIQILKDHLIPKDQLEVQEENQGKLAGSLAEKQYKELMDKLENELGQRT